MAGPMWFSRGPQIPASTDCQKHSLIRPEQQFSIDQRSIFIEVGGEQASALFTQSPQARFIDRVESDKQLAVAIPTLKTQNIVLRPERTILSPSETRVALSERNERAVQIENRTRLPLLVRNVARAFSKGKPRRAVGEATASARVPSHGRTLGIAPDPVTADQFLERVMDAALRYLTLLCADFVAHVEERRPS